jgi:hypothetical protein
MSNPDVQDISHFISALWICLVSVSATNESDDMRLDHCGNSFFTSVTVDRVVQPSQLGFQADVKQKRAL